MSTGGLNILLLLGNGDNRIRSCKQRINTEFGTGHQLKHLIWDFGTLEKHGYRRRLVMSLFFFGVSRSLVASIS